MIIRHIYSELLSWKGRSKRKPLVLRGARQVGKSFIIRTFGTEQFNTFLELNLEKATHCDLFSAVESAHNLVHRIETFFATKVTPGNTLIFIDEIQSSEIALQMLRYFYEEYPELHIIAAGSFLEQKIKSLKISIPVGRVEYLYMRPLSFSEYLHFRHGSHRAAQLQDNNLEQFSDPIIHEQYLRFFSEYVVIGGMPEAVSTYVETNNLASVTPIYESIVKSLKDDVYKYGTTAQAPYLHHAIEYAPLFVGKQIVYKNFAGSQYRSREMSHAFDALHGAMILKKIMATASQVPPLIPKPTRAIKLLFLDSGLVCHAFNSHRVLIPDFTILGNSLINEEYRGQIAEQVAGQLLLCRNHREDPTLNYWGRERQGAQAETDFILPIGGAAIPIEIKSGHHGRAKSLGVYFDGSSKAAHCAVKINARRYQIEKRITPKGRSYKVITLPFYLTEKLEEIVQREW